MNKNKKGLSRYTFLTFCVLLIIGVIISKLVYIQIIKADEYALLADRNYIRTISEPARRGNIVDSKNRLLATSKNSFDLVYMQTDESKKDFFKTMKIVFEILDSNQQIQDDDFALNVDPYSLNFKTTSASTRDWMETRFKKDRGMDDYFAKKIYEKQYKELEKNQQKKIDDKLLTVSPKDTFEYLESKDIYNLKDKNMSIKEKRRYMIVLDKLRMQSFSGYKPVTIAKNIKRETAFQFYERLSELPGIDIVTEPIRYYPYGELASSIIGYISKINSIEKEKYEEKGYDISTDLVGIAGIENAFENRLRGSKGQKTVKVNTYGRIVEELFKKNSYPGQNIQLTIDADVQYAAEKSLEATMKDLRTNHNRGDVNTVNATRGAAVAIDVKNGNILALASLPQFDPNIFTIPGKLNDEIYNKYFISNFAEQGKQYIQNMGLGGQQNLYDLMFPIDTSIKNNKTIRKDNYDVIPKPTWNYATLSLLPPGSTFKPITAIAGLEEGVINENSSIYCSGIFDKYGNTGKSWKCWNIAGHGPMNVISALEESCNVFFYNVGDMLYHKYSSDSKVDPNSYNTLAKYAWQFGLGKETGIEIPEAVKYSHPYNLESSMKNDGFMFQSNAVNILKNGYEQGRGYRFKPIDITIKKVNDKVTDPEKVIEIKKKINKTIEDTIKCSPIDKDVSASKYTNQLNKQLTDLIDTYSDEIKKQYTKKDIENASQAVINYCIWDANTQLYSPGNVINASIGQGEHQFTPVQLANFMATIANGGKRYELHLFKKALDDEGKVLEEQQSRILGKVKVKDSTMDTVQRGLKGVTTEGTASSAFTGFPMVTVGKTGSSTFQANQELFGRTSYAVYAGYAPYENPEIAVAVVIFDGGHGGYAAPVAKAIYEAYFKDRLKKEYPNYVPQYNYKLEPNKTVSQNIEEIDNGTNKN